MACSDYIDVDTEAAPDTLVTVYVVIPHFTGNGDECWWSNLDDALDDIETHFGDYVNNSAGPGEPLDCGVRIQSREVTKAAADDVLQDHDD